MKNKLTFTLILALIAYLLFSQKMIDKKTDTEQIMESNMALATFGNGCFWCTEAIFQQLKGVENVVPGYAGGSTDNPTYKEVCSGSTGHAEVIQMSYDPEVISYRELLDVFFYTHDPTTLNRQGNDVGTQYRSAIYYHDESQKNDALKIIEQLELEKVYEDKIVTEVTALDKFYLAENYHNDYYNNNKNQGYCRAVINPKLDKFVKKYKSKIK
jgi:peptide-methionine (S)-S-oxide reductase